MTAKQQAMAVIERLPAKATFGDIAYEIEVLGALREAEADIKHGRVHSIDEVRKMIPEWASKSSSPSRHART